MTDIDGGTCWQCGTKRERITELEQHELGFIKSLIELEADINLSRSDLQKALSKTTDIRQKLGESQFDIVQLEAQVAGYELQINSMVISHREQQQQHDETRRLAKAVVDIHEMNSVHPCQAMDELKAHLDGGVET